MDKLPIKKRIVLDFTYGSEYQYQAHHKHFLLFLEAFKWGMFGDTNYTMFRHKDNALGVTGDIEQPREEDVIMHTDDPEKNILNEIRFATQSENDLPSNE